MKEVDFFITDINYQVTNMFSFPTKLQQQKVNQRNTRIETRVSCFYTDTAGRKEV